MEDWVFRAMARWPDVPALFGWLALDRRGRWRIKGELIQRPQVIDTINANYAADADGRWFFQNGPQRGYVALAYTPLVLQFDTDGRLWTHTGLPVTSPEAAYMDEDGAITLVSEHGPGVVRDDDLPQMLERLRGPTGPADEAALMTALDASSGRTTALTVALGPIELPVVRLDAAELPRVTGFVREPRPKQGEKHSW